MLSPEEANLKITENQWVKHLRNREQIITFLCLAEEELSRGMTKPTELCAQRRLRSALASAQSDQSLCCGLNG